MKIGLFLPQNNHFYARIATALKTGFEAFGHKVFYDLKLYESDMLLQFCRCFEPDCIFEMNRSKNEIDELPGNIIHIAWIVDLLGRDINDIQESELIYFFGTGWKDLHVNKHESFVDWLPPGFCPDTYKPTHRSKIFDFSFIGHIPRPWASTELNRIIYAQGDTYFTFKQLFEQCQSTWAQHGGLHQLRPRQYLQMIEDVLRSNINNDFRINDRIIKYDIETRSTRMINRQTLMDKALSSSSSTSIFGSNNWLEWPNYRPFYAGYLDTHDKVRNIYQSTKLSLHEGIGIHFRTLDCMGAGGTLAFMPTSRDDLTDGINSHFEPFRHYIPIDINGDCGHLKYYLKNDSKILKIAQEASLLVKQKHTWYARCKKILSNIASL